MDALNAPGRIDACTPLDSGSRRRPSPSGAPASKQAPPVDTPRGTASVSVPASPVAATAATGTPMPGNVVPPSPAGTRYAYTCEGGKKFEAVFFPASAGKATLILDGKSIDLKQERSASGVRYSDGGTLVLSTKGADAFIEQGGTQTYKGCTGAPVAG